MQKVCILSFTHLLLLGPTLVLLRSNHWRVHVTAVQQAAVTISGVQPPASGSGMTIAPAPPPRSQKAYHYYEPPAEGEEQERDDLICQILSDMICQSSSGWVCPSATKGDWRLLRRYVPPGGLKQFIRSHEQFQLAQVAGTRWAFSFAEQDLGEPPDVHAPVSDSVPLRVLDLYILIRDGSKATFMRSKPYRLCLRAPPPRPRTEQRRRDPAAGLARPGAARAWAAATTSGSRPSTSS